MIASNSVENTAWKGDTHGIPDHTNDHIYYESLLLSLAKHTDQVVCEPVLDARNYQIEASQGH